MTKAQPYMWVTAQLPKDYDYLAPDGSEIRLLPEVAGGGLAHCWPGAQEAVPTDGYWSSKS